MINFGTKVLQDHPPSCTICMLLIAVLHSSKGHQLHVNIFLDALYSQVFTHYETE